MTKRFGAGSSEVRAVDEISFRADAGEFVLIMGPSGSGKTTLLMMMGGILRPTDGAVLVDGEDIFSMPRRLLPDLRLKYFGFVFQTPNLLSSLTARQNVELALNLGGTRGRMAKEEAKSLLKTVGLRDRGSYRQGQLSGGEQQRVAIARALANSPSVIMADEPTANLDSRSGREIMTMLKGLTREHGQSCIIVSHDPRIAGMADRIIVLEDGRIREP